MKRAGIGLAIGAILVCASGPDGRFQAAQQGGAGQPPEVMSIASQEALVNQYCAGCHNDRAKAGDFSFTSLDLAHVDQNASQAEEVILKLRTGLMPPAGRPTPGSDILKAFASALENAIDRVAVSNPNPGRPLLHRLNRTEYGNAIYDMFGMNIDPELLLPPDDMSHGFDNMSAVLSISPSLMDGYIRAAGKIGRMAVGDPAMKPVVETYPLTTAFSQLGYVEGTPMGSRGGVAVVHNFPADGEYVFIISPVFAHTQQVYGITSRDPKVEVAVNGERVALLDIKREMTVDQVLKTPPIKVRAGPQTISASFPKGFNSTDGPYEDFLRQRGRSLGDTGAGTVAGLTSLPHIRDLGVSGPFNATGVSDTEFRRRIFLCRPTRASDEEPCARRIISALARQAFRVPVGNEHLEELMAAYQTGRGDGDFEAGIRLAVQLLLSHPEFIFRFEYDPPNALPGTNHRISDLELASRLSYFLWSRGPDDELVTIASQGRLKDPAVLVQQVKRMLADPRSEALAKNFAGQWLYLRNLKDAEPDYFVYPMADVNLFQSMRRETELLFDSIVRENRGVLDLLTANYTFVDENLAKHYKIPNILGNNFSRVTLTDENRHGLLGQGSILTVTSFANRTSPVLRGKWVLEQILGVVPPPPPPNVPALKEIPVNGGEIVKRQTVRERLEQHRALEPCNSCHKIMDPLGLALENFDAVGAWRTKDQGFPVDTSGQLVDGTKVNNPVALRQALMARSDAFTRNFISKLLTYALGRGVEYSDMPAVRAIDREAAKDGYRFESIVMGIVKSIPFQMRTVEQSAEAGAVR